MDERSGTPEVRARGLNRAVGHLQTPADPLNPAHYQSGGIEAIDVIEAFNLSFSLGNAVKYILRAGRKGEARTDLQKAKWYLDREIEKKQ